MPPRGDDKEPWHLDKKVPIALIVTILFQTGAALWWASKLDSRLGVVERHATEVADHPARIVRLEAFRDDLGHRLDRIEAKLDRLVEHGVPR